MIQEATLRKGLTGKAIGLCPPVGPGLREPPLVGQVPLCVWWSNPICSHNKRFKVWMISLLWVLSKSNLPNLTALFCETCENMKFSWKSLLTNPVEAAKRPSHAFGLMTQCLIFCHEWVRGVQKGQPSMNDWIL